MEINIFLLLVLALFIYLVKENGGKYFRKALGSFLIIFGAYLILPWPGLDDAILFPLFSSFMDWDISLVGFKQNFLPYTFITTGTGFLIMWVGAYISDLKTKSLLNKIKRIFQKYI